MRVHAAEMVACDRELELVRLRARRTGIARGLATPEQREQAWQLEEQIRNAEGETLEALRESAEKAKDLAERSVDLSKSRMKVWEAQRELIKSVGRPD